MDKVVDIVKLAMASEVKARRYYEKAAELTTGGEALMIFIELMEMEETHARRLVEAFGARMKESGIDAEAFLEDLEKNPGPVMGDAENLLLQSADMREILDFAMNMERMARNSYRELAGHVETPELRALCEDLAQEEQRHHDLLYEARSGVDMPLDERPAL